jgi:hypothetical protein
MPDPLIHKRASTIHPAHRGTTSASPAAAVLASLPPLQIPPAEELEALYRRFSASGTGQSHRRAQVYVLLDSAVDQQCSGVAFLFPIFQSIQVVSSVDGSAVASNDCEMSVNHWQCRYILALGNTKPSFTSVCTSSKYPPLPISRVNAPVMRWIFAFMMADDAFFHDGRRWTPRSLLGRLRT